MALGKRIKALREARKLSQFELSELTGGVVSQGAISALEKRDSTASRFAEVLAKALNVSIADLFDQNLNLLKQEVAQYNIKDFAKYTDKLNTAERAQVENLLAHFVVLNNKHKELVINLIDSLYNVETSLKKVARMRGAPDTILRDNQHDGRTESKKIKATKL